MVLMLKIEPNICSSGERKEFICYPGIIDLIDAHKTLPYLAPWTFRLPKEQWQVHLSTERSYGSLESPKPAEPTTKQFALQFAVPELDYCPFSTPGPLSLPFLGVPAPEFCILPLA